jgi:hypothetical protein
MQKSDGRVLDAKISIIKDTSLLLLTSISGVLKRLDTTKRMSLKEPCQGSFPAERTIDHEREALPI